MNRSEVQPFLRVSVPPCETTSISTAELRVNGTRPDVGVLVTHTPVLRPFLIRMAKRALQGQPLPARFTVRGLDYAAQGALEGLLGAPLARKADGTVTGTLPPRWREPSAWQTVISVLGLAREDAADSTETFLTRLAWRAPEARTLIDALQTMPEVMRFVRNPAHRDSWKRLLLGVFKHVRAGVGGEKTLSQLGSDWLNDSKALRTGPLRRQLALMLSGLEGRDVDERTLFGPYGIIENPYTSFVTFFAPLVFTTDAGETFDFPARLFAAGQACTLPSETVGRIRSVAWQGDDRSLITSENAAPFARYVTLGRPALYTEGYPNYAVQRFLRTLGDAGVEAEHAGDADLDGFRIAALVGRCLPIRRVLAAEVVRNPGDVVGIPLTEAQQMRARRFLAESPHMPYAEEVSVLLKKGCWYEQESFPL